jgi:hypothetical protein
LAAEAAYTPSSIKIAPATRRWQPRPNGREKVPAAQRGDAARKGKEVRDEFMVFAQWLEPTP